ANLRLLFTYQWTYPGKQLIFMGSEFAQETEWDAGSPLPWSRSEGIYPAGVSALLSDLNHLQAGHSALSQWDCDQRGFEWLNGDDVEQSVISFIRNSENESLLVVLNFTPVPRQGYRIAVPEAGKYLEIFNSDDDLYRGSGMGNKDPLRSEATAHWGREHSLCLTLPPLAGIVLQRQEA
ncbi:MAG: alpha amylase C-terminal domain-containing protein, partial [Lysobacterales bacterium]